MHISLSTVRQFLQSTVLVLQEIEAFEAQFSSSLSLKSTTTNPANSPVSLAPVAPTTQENLDARDDAGIDAVPTAA